MVTGGFGVIMGITEYAATPTTMMMAAAISSIWRLVNFLAF
jgi:hypothetical protein